MAMDKGENPLPENDPVVAENIVKLGNPHKVREFKSLEESDGAL